MRALESMLQECLPALAAGTARRDPQDDSVATWGTKRTPDDGRIDWTQPATIIWRLIRAVGKPYPGAFTNDGTSRLVIWEARPEPGEGCHAALPGQVIACDADRFTVCCGDGAALRVTSYNGNLPKLHTQLGGSEVNAWNLRRGSSLLVRTRVQFAGVASCGCSSASAGRRVELLQCFRARRAIWESS